MNSTRSSFVEHFGEEQACAIEDAASEHVNESNSANRGSDHFRWCISIVIGYNCVKEDRFREHHKITIPFDKFQEWVKTHGDLGKHDGDFDYLAFFAGVYNEYCEAKD